MVQWDNGAKTWDRYSLVRADFPILVKKFEDNLKKEKMELESGQAHVQPETIKSPTKGRVQTQIEVPGKCDADHTNIMSFKEEGDTRYWDQGNAFENTHCHRCKNNSRPINWKKPSYVCVKWASHGCVELRCNICYIDMVVNS